jgi:hypothetical protein
MDLVCWLALLQKILTFLSSLVSGLCMLYCIFIAYFRYLFDEAWSQAFK